MRIGALRVDEPLSAFPPIEDCAALINIVDRRHRFGLKLLRRQVGRAQLRRALASQHRWLVGIAGSAGVVVLGAHSEDALVQLHRDVLDMAAKAPGHLEVYHFLEPELRARIVADWKQHALRITPAQGTA